MHRNLTASPVRSAIWQVRGIVGDAHRSLCEQGDECSDAPSRLLQLPSRGRWPMAKRNPSPKTPRRPREIEIPERRYPLVNGCINLGRRPVQARVGRG